MRKNKKDKNKQVRSIIKEYYGGNSEYFVFNYASNIYNIPEVRTAIESFADIFSTIPIYHERVDKGGGVVYLEDKLTRVLSLKPNPFQNATQFWKTVFTRLFLKNNVFIESELDELGNVSALYPVQYLDFAFECKNSTPKVSFSTENGMQVKNLEDLIYLNRFSDFSKGKTNNLGLYETVIQALTQQIVNVANPKKVRALLQNKSTGSNLKDKDKNGAIKAIKANFDENIDGLAYLDQQWTVTPINWTENDVNRELMQFVVSIVYNYFGISESIINNTASEIEMAMFIQNKVKPVVLQIERELTSKLFSMREIEFGHRIEFDVFALQVTTLQTKTSLFSIGSRQGIMNIDEMREYIGQPPLPNKLGQMYRVSADTINIEKVDEYQAAQKGVVKTSTKKEDLKEEK